MKKKLTFKESMFIGSMLSGLFFGAGDLIFPMHLGQAAGSSAFIANLGLLITAVSLPFLGIIAIGISKTSGLFGIASHISKTYAYIFTIALYLVTGPFFALPRLATTSFKVTSSPFLPSKQIALHLLIFSFIFPVIAWSSVRKPSRISEHVGESLDPVFSVLLAIILLFALIHSLGGISDASTSKQYQLNVLFNDFLDEYNTLGALVSLVFGIIIVATIKELSIESPVDIARETIKSGTISIIMMEIIYALLAIIDTLGISRFKFSKNGGIALVQTTQYYLGSYGIALLSLIIMVVCLKTAIDLITAFPETFRHFFPKMNYLAIATVISFIPFLFANVGLTKIIMYSVPVLMSLYPLAIILIVLILFSSKLYHSKIIYQCTIFFTMIAALVDGLKTSPELISGTSFSQTSINFSQKYLPLSDIGIGWVIFSLIGFIIGFTIYKIKYHKISQA